MNAHLLSIEFKRNRVTTSKVVFYVAEAQSRRVFALLHKHGRNVDSPQYTGHQAALGLS